MYMCVQKHDENTLPTYVWMHVLDFQVSLLCTVIVTLTVAVRDPVSACVLLFQSVH